MGYSNSALSKDQMINTILQSFFFRVLGVGYSKRGLSSFCVFVISRNEMPVTSYFGYSGTNPMFTVFLKT